jgi:hypothetical protein
MNVVVPMRSGAAIRTKFDIDWFRHSKVVRKYTQALKQHGDLTSLMYFFKIRKIG